MGSRSTDVLTFTNCKACGKQIYWCVYPKTGKRAPIDTEVDPKGNIIVSSNGTYRFKTADDVGEQLHLNHFVTCSQPQRFTTKRRQGNRNRIHGKTERAG